MPYRLCAARRMYDQLRDPVSYRDEWTHGRVRAAIKIAAWVLVGQRVGIYNDSRRWLHWFTPEERARLTWPHLR